MPPDAGPRSPTTSASTSDDIHNVGTRRSGPPPSWPPIPTPALTALVPEKSSPSAVLTA